MPALKQFWIFGALITTADAAQPIGKIHRYDNQSGEATISLTGASAPRQKVFIESGEKHFPCAIKASYHTKVTCLTAKGLKLTRGLFVYSAQPKEKEKPAPLPVVVIPEILGTTWQGKNLAEKRFEFFFDNEYVLEYRSANGNYRDGIWEVRGNKVKIGVNDSYAIYEGVISGDTIEGKGFNKSGERWVWKMERVRP